MSMDYEKTFKKLILNAIDKNTTDIHLQLSNKEQRCEFRTINGLIEVKQFKFDQSLFEYIKYISNLDLLTDLKPQSGRIKIKLNQTEYFIRCAYFKNYIIETIVLRILNPKNLLNIDILFNEYSNRIRHYMNQSSGLILFSGSTGSGKTTSMFTCLKELKHKKIYSIEDPIEYFYDHLVQLEVNSNQSFNFKEAIKQVLRHDPNVIVIGEIRDDTEAKAAIRCALSGHLVLSTIHANSARMTIERLKDMQIEESVLKEVINLVIYQELNIDEENHVIKAKFEFFEF